MKTIEIQQTIPFEHQNDTTIQYRLIAIKGERDTRYEISVTFGRERAAALLPFADRADALSAYEKIRNGLVTPTTLTDIVEDMK